MRAQNHLSRLLQCTRKQTDVEQRNRGGRRTADFAVDVLQPKRVERRLRRRLPRRRRRRGAAPRKAGAVDAAQSHAPGVVANGGGGGGRGGDRRGDGNGATTARDHRPPSRGRGARRLLVPALVSVLDVAAVGWCGRAPGGARGRFGRFRHGEYFEELPSDVLVQLNGDAKRLIERCN